MKNLLLIGIILGFPLMAQTQNEYKNEASIGYFSVGEFFDETPAKFTSFNKGKSCSINYTRSLDKNISIGLTYALAGFGYIPIDADRLYLKRYTVESRFQRIFTANMGYSLSKWGLVVRGKAGVRYNQFSVKLLHHTCGIHANGWGECFRLADHYAKLGLSAGISIAHPIFWRIFGEFDSEFAKMFSGADRNQLLLSYRIGIRF